MNINHIFQSAEQAIQGAKDIAALEKIRIQFLGRKGEITKILRSIKTLPTEERQHLGEQANDLRDNIKKLIDLKVKEFIIEATAQSHVDLTMPAKKISAGHLHPLTIVANQVKDIFRSMNFSVVEGSEIETEHYNFDALNIPEHHPAREMWDTFWLKQDKKNNERLLLRTHTSPVQIRYMERHTPPFQIIVPGRVFRYEATDASHEVNFYQVEGLVVGKHVTLAHLKYVTEAFLKRIIGNNVTLRFRPSYFPFTEPSIEVDVKMKGKWLEIMGAGMVHPEVFSAAHYLPNEWQGFAFGLGLDRIAMLKYGIPDIRLFYSGDLRITQQFKDIA